MEQEKAVYFSGHVGDLQLFEITNYPRATNSDLDFAKIKRQEMMGKLLQQEEVIKFQFASYNKKEFYN